MRPLSIYIHYPYCLSKCRYCAFASSPACGRDGGELLSAYLKEMDFYAGLCGGREVVSVYFGGGTPSLAKVGFVEAILARARKNWRLTRDCEITLEANPATCSRDKLLAFQAVGINRLSIGVQSDDDEVLKFLGRAHNARQAMDFVGTAAAIFPNYNVDLMYGLPGQSATEWERSVRRFAAAPHLSLYQLSVEKGTDFYRSRVREADEAAAVKMFETAGRIKRRYEVSNYASPGFESVHNVGYWSGRDYLGIGSGAAGRLCVDGKFYETKNVPNPQEWAAASPKLKPLSRKNRAIEMVMSGLRMVDGISRAEFVANLGMPVEEVLKPHESLVWGREKIRFKKSAFLKMDAILPGIIL